MLVFLFTDIEGSTRLWEEHTGVMIGVIARHDAILRELVEGHGGRITKHTGDGITAVFETGQPLVCALETQVRFAAEPWPEIGTLLIRAGLHAGEAEFHPSAGTPEGDYFGPPVNATARVMSAAWGGQILLTPEVTQASALPDQATLLDLGQHLLKNVSAPQQLYQLLHPQLPRQEFPPPRTLSGQSIRRQVDERGQQMAGLEPQEMGIALLSATVAPTLQGDLDPESGALANNLGVLEDLGALSLRGFVAGFAERLRAGKPLPSPEIQALLQRELQIQWQAGGEVALALRADASLLLQAVHGIEAAMTAATAEVKEALARGLADLGEQFGEFRWMLTGMQDILAEVQAGQRAQVALQLEQAAMQREQLELQREQLAKTDLLVRLQLAEEPLPPWLKGPHQLPAFLEQGSDIEPPVFVSRENELALLDRFLNHALKGRGQVAFITGDPGQGKTALAQAFARRAQTVYPSLVVASGNCNAYTGIGDPYLPFREILGLLTGDIESLQETGAISQTQARQLWRIFPLTVQAVVESGNYLVDIFVPGATLLQRAAGATGWPGKEVWLAQLKQLVVRKAALSGELNIQQTALFEQYSRVMRSLAQQYPLLLIVDDLQWADVGSISLLCHLGKRLEASRILVIGLYRSSEVALGREGERHPLEPVLNELRQQFGENQIDVGQSEGRPFVDAFLDSEPNRLGEEFRLALFRFSGGHPLTTIEMLRDLQERGGLVRDASGCWVEGPALNWESLPVRVEAMIAERMGRLGERELSVLRAASVQGQTFSAEVVGQVLEVEEGEMIHCLSGVLDRRHRLVSAQGIRRSNGQRISSYRFRHILFQKYLYNSMDVVERSHLHQAMGSALQALYGQENVEIAVELARHFQEAGTVGQAADYLSRAGDRASHLVAYAEAIRHYGQARSAYERAYGSGWSPLERAELERKMAEAQFRQGEHAQAVEHLERALEYLGQPVPATRWRLRLAIGREIAVQIVHRLFSRWLVKPIGGPVDAVAVGAVSCFETLGWIEVMMNADRFLYLTLRALNFSEHSGYGHGIVEASAGFGIILQFLGLLKLAGGYGQRSLKVGETIQDSIGLSFAYFGLAMLRLSEGDLQAGITFAEKSAQIGRREDDLRQWGMGENLVSACLLYQGRLAECASAVQDMLRAGQEGGDQTVECWGLSKQGHQLWKTGRLDEAVASLEACVKLAEAIPDLKFRVEAGAGLGRSLLRLGKLDQALSVLEDARELNRRNPQGGGMREGLAVAVAEAYVAAAEQSTPRERKTWLRKARRACRDAMKASWTARHRKPEVLLLRGRLAWISNRPAAAVRDWQRSLALAEAAGQQFDLGRVHLEMGRRLGDREHLERAQTILAEIGAEGDLACAHEALGKLSDQT